jgi:hypothetical protein
VHLTCVHREQEEAADFRFQRAMGNHQPATVSGPCYLTAVESDEWAPNPGNLTFHSPKGWYEKNGGTPAWKVSEKGNRIAVRRPGRTPFFGGIFGQAPRLVGSYPLNVNIEVVFSPPVPGEGYLFAIG